MFTRVLSIRSVNGTSDGGDERTEGTSERKREREVSERPASQSPPVATVCLRHPVTTVDD